MTIKTAMKSQMGTKDRMTTTTTITRGGMRMIFMFDDLYGQAFPFLPCSYQQSTTVRQKRILHA